jgi:NADH-quinone oxidoreductase subunit M
VHVPLLSVIVFWPVAAALLLFLGALLGTRGATAARYFAVAASVVEMILVALAIGPTLAAHGGYALGENVAWMPLLGIDYRLGVDGLSLVLIGLTALLGFVAVLMAQAQTLPRQPQYLALLLLTEASAMGIFLSLDLVLFYLFWETVIIPVYLLIAGWGGDGRRAAATKFLIMSLAGSLLMLVGIVAVASAAAQATGAFMFDLPTLLSLHLAFPANLGYAAFGAFALAFAIKTPLFPFHAWQPDAYAESPPPVTVVLAGVLSKAGLYGFLRFLLPLFPDQSAHLQPLMMSLGIAGVVYGSAVALAQRDMKRLLAFASLAHVGLITAGIFAMNAIGVEGAVLQMASHGLVAGGAFVVVGVIEARTASRDLGVLGGLMGRMPILAGFGMLVTMALLGLPGLSSFAGEFLLILGTFQRSLPLAIGGGVGMALAAVYGLRLYQAAFHHAPRGPEATGDLRAHDIVALAPLAALILLLGVVPGVATARASASLSHVLVTRGSRR